MKTILRLIGRISAATGYTERLLAARKSSKRPSLTILAYHRIGSRAVLHGAPESLLDEKLISATPADFDWHIDFLRRHFILLTAQDVLAAASDGASLPPNSLLITFDDGYRDNFDLAFPILARKQAPALIFLTTGLVGGVRLPWWDEVSFLLRSARVDLIYLPALGQIDISSNARRMRAMEKLRQVFKSLPADQISDLLAELRRQLGFGDHLPAGGRFFLDWGEVAEMGRGGVDFGAHTHAHPILTRITLAQAEEEILTAQRIITAQTGTTPRFFAYPNGQPGDFNAGIQRLLVRHGFLAAATLVPGSNPLTAQPDWLALRRVSIHYDNRTVFAARVSGVFDRLSLAAQWPVQSFSQPHGALR